MLGICTGAGMQTPVLTLVWQVLCQLSYSLALLFCCLVNCGSHLLSWHGILSQWQCSEEGESSCPAGVKTLVRVPWGDAYLRLFWSHGNIFNLVYTRSLTVLWKVSSPQWSICKRSQCPYVHSQQYVSISKAVHYLTHETQKAVPTPQVRIRLTPCADFLPGDEDTETKTVSCFQSDLWLFWYDQLQNEYLFCSSSNMCTWSTYYD